MSNPSWRVYLDNYDLLEKVEATEMTNKVGTLAPGVLCLRQEYEKWDIPRNVKKSVSRASRCELQGATVDGTAGVAYPREAKLNKYFLLVLSLAQLPYARQKQWQVACGGLVYFSMFRRPLLECLNHVWKHIQDYERLGRHVLPTPPECRLEMLRFLGLLPLARLDFRLDMHPQVSCSDASTTGGGICANVGTTPIGSMVAHGGLRGQWPEQGAEAGILAVGLFDGIGALRVALELLGIPVIGYVSVESQDAARKVVESHFPGVLHYDDVRTIDAEAVKHWSTLYTQVSMVIIGAGPPCQGVSGLNSDRKGALRDQRSCLFKEVPRIRDEVKKHFAWCPVFVLMESVASMDKKDRDIMSAGIGTKPIMCDAGSFTWCHRPRLYWCDWELRETKSQFVQPSDGDSPPTLILTGYQDIAEVTRSGWLKVAPDKPFPTFTTSRPRTSPGRKPAGLAQCSSSELRMWEDDSYRFPPYQYRREHCLVNKNNVLRLPDVAEREMMLGFPVNYTSGCLAKQLRGHASYNDCRLTLLGNTWSVPVIAALLNQLFATMGMMSLWECQDILDELSPGHGRLVQGRLFRLPLNTTNSKTPDESRSLAFKLGNLISIKGEDIMLTTPTTQMVRFHRLRATVPARCWRWRVVAGWRWTKSGDHINCLELRAILTTMKWRLEHAHHRQTRFIHLTDSLVCLHALTRGRTSSRKLRRTMSRINALSLAANVQPLWGYVNTHQNPADKPSRWGRRVRTKFRNAKA